MSNWGQKIDNSFALSIAFLTMLGLAGIGAVKLLFILIEMGILS